jgi:hypothetical protein
VFWVVCYKYNLQSLYEGCSLCLIPQGRLMPPPFLGSATHGWRCRSKKCHSNISQLSRYPTWYILEKSNFNPNCIWDVLTGFSTASFLRPKFLIVVHWCLYSDTFFHQKLLLYCDYVTICYHTLQLQSHFCHICGNIHIRVQLLALWKQCCVTQDWCKESWKGDVCTWFAKNTLNECLSVHTFHWNLILSNLH